jgi:dienelactone hydrolase
MAQDVTVLTGGAEATVVVMAPDAGRLPPAATPPPSPRPVVLLVHDALGVDPRSMPYLEQLEDAGFVVAQVELRASVLDGTGPAQEPPLVGTAEVALLRQAARTLATRAGTDPARVAAIGFGAGAWAVALASGGDDPFAARVLLYPGCDRLAAELASDRTAPPRTPVLLLHGGADPANTDAACAALAATLAKSGATVRLRRYQAATYGWDIPAFGGAAVTRQPRPDGPGRVTARAWPELAAVSAAETTGFLANALQQPR